MLHFCEAFYFINSNKTIPLGASGINDNSPIPERFRRDFGKFLLKIIRRLTL
jgi:hypothetical protein